MIKKKPISKMKMKRILKLKIKKILTSKMKSRLKMIKKQKLKIKRKSKKEENDIEPKNDIKVEIEIIKDKIEDNKIEEIIEDKNDLNNNGKQTTEVKVEPPIESNKELEEKVEDLDRENYSRPRKKKKTFLSNDHIPKKIKKRPDLSPRRKKKLETVPIHKILHLKLDC